MLQFTPPLKGVITVSTVIRRAQMLIVSLVLASGVFGAVDVPGALAWKPPTITLKGACQGVTIVAEPVIEHGVAQPWRILEIQDSTLVTMDTTFTPKVQGQSFPFPVNVTDYNHNHQVLVIVGNAANIQDGHSILRVEVPTSCAPTPKPSVSATAQCDAAGGGSGVVTLKNDLTATADTDFTVTVNGEFFYNQTLKPGESQVSPSFPLSTSASTTVSVTAPGMSPYTPPPFPACPSLVTPTPPSTPPTTTTTPPVVPPPTTTTTAPPVVSPPGVCVPHFRKINPAIYSITGPAVIGPSASYVAAFKIRGKSVYDTLTIRGAHGNVFRVRLHGGNQTVRYTAGQSGVWAPPGAVPYAPTAKVFVAFHIRRTSCGHSKWAVVVRSIPVNNQN